VFGHHVEDLDLVTIVSQPGCVHSGDSADVHDVKVPTRQTVSNDLPGVQELKLAVALPDPSVLVDRAIVVDHLLWNLRNATARYDVQRGFARQFSPPECPQRRDDHARATTV
jgi:hypothetical protein